MGWKDLFSKPGIQSSFVVEYNKLFEQQSTAHKSLSKCTFVVLDTETTGLNIKKDYIISCGSIKIQNEAIKVSTARHYFLNPKKEDRTSITVHQIIGVKNALPLPKFVEFLLNDVGNAVLVGHHIGFDKAMLEKAARPFGLKKLQNYCVDTYELAIRLELGKYSDPQRIDKNDYKLDALCQRYKIPLDDRHTAAGDAFLTAQLFLKLLKIAQQKGIKTCRSLIS